jgi:hypothetical protein
VAATSLPRWILGHYDIGARARTAWWGHARLPEGRAQLPEGCARLPEGRARLPEIEGDVMSQKNHEPKKMDKNVTKQEFMGKINYFLRTLPLSPWAISAIWLHVGAP